MKTRTTKIVTSFIKHDEKILLLKRSDKVKYMSGLWAGISGIIEKRESPLKRAKTEIFEEVGIKEEKIKLVRASNEMKVNSPQYKNQEWTIFPFLFETKEAEVRLNWENSEYVWINVDELPDYKTVPSLDKVLFSLL